MLAYFIYVYWNSYFLSFYLLLICILQFSNYYEFRVYLRLKKSSSTWISLRSTFCERICDDVRVTIFSRAYSNYCLHMSTTAQVIRHARSRRTRTRELWQTQTRQNKQILLQTRRWIGYSALTRCVVVCASSASLSYGNCYARWLYIRATCWDAILCRHARDPSVCLIRRRHDTSKLHRSWINVLVPPRSVYSSTQGMCPKIIP